MVAEATRTRKPRVQPIPYVPSVELIDYQAGAYSVQSQSDPTEFYITTVGRADQAVTCTCKAGQTEFVGCLHQGVCKHVLSARIVDGALADLVMQQQAKAAAQQAPATVEPRPVHPAVAALLECYPA